MMKQLSRALVGALVIVVALAAFNVTFPTGGSTSGNWRFVLTHPTILGHVIVGTGILVVAAISLIASLRRRDRTWIAVSAAGLAFSVLAVISGVKYVQSLQENALTWMSVGWAGAVIVYGTGWYLGRRRERAVTKTRASTSGA